jgi:hypothetical protein
MNPNNPAQNVEYTPSCDAVTMATPNSRRLGIEDATIRKGSNQITHEEAVDAISHRHPAKAAGSMTTTDGRVTTSAEVA